MTCSPRTFIVGPDDTLYRLASAKFSRMLDDPEHDRLPRFAGQRVRMVDAIVELRDRTPCAVVRLVYEMLGFDARGRLDRRAFERQNVALANLLVDRVVGGSTTNEATIVDASSRFVAQMRKSTGSCRRQTNLRIDTPPSKTPQPTALRAAAEL